jgi:hypothetical protein
VIPVSLLASLLAFVIGSLPAHAAALGGHRLLIGDDSKGRIAIVESDGHLSWEHKIGPIHDLALLPDGNILFQTSWTRIVEMTPAHETVWSYDSATQNGNEGKQVEVHAFQRLPDGSTMIAESGVARIIEVDRSGKLLHTVRLKIDHPSTHSDTRMVRRLANGHYLVCHESDGAVREYDAEGKVVWDFPVPLFGQESKPGHGPEAFGNAVFGAVRLANGNTLVAAGNGHSLLEVTPQKEIVWKVAQHDLPGITLAWITSLNVLPNGHIVFGNCHAGPDNPQIIEITRDKQVVWSFKDFEHFGNSMPVSAVLDGSMKPL